MDAAYALLVHDVPAMSTVAVWVDQGARAENELQALCTALQAHSLTVSLGGPGYNHDLIVTHVSDLVSDNTHSHRWNSPKFNKMLAAPIPRLAHVRYVVRLYRPYRD